MIGNRDHKTSEIVETIKNDLSGARLFGVGPKLRLYRRLLGTRAQCSTAQQFLMHEAHIRLLYDTLEAWNMNMRGAIMKSFEGFRASVVRCVAELSRLEESGQSHQFSARFRKDLRAAYESLDVMVSRAKLVANAKLLHFLLPELLMPMDRQHTLSYFYGNPYYQSAPRYLEVVELSFEIMGLPENWNVYLDKQWNTTVPKLIDNAVVVLQRRKK